MARPTLLERASKYVAVMPASLSGSGGHNAAFAAACALVKGFNLSVDQARPIMGEFNGRCAPAWSEREIEHKLIQADKTADEQARGYLIGDGKHVVGEHGKAAPAKRVLPPVAKPQYDESVLAEFAGAWADVVDVVWLGNRSAIDPAKVSTSLFLKLMYGEEKVVIFDNEYSQGCALWPNDAERLPTTALNGCWFLAQPVDGQYHPNPRSVDRETGRAKMSRRSEESVTSWRYLVIESDEAPLKLWLGALARLPLRIAAIYTSGGRSIHALVRVDAKTKGHWDAIKAECFGQNAPAGRFLIRNGADKGVLSAVRLTRLPGCYREGKFSEKEGRSVYVKFPRPQLQKLLYLQPEPECVPLVDVFAKRDVEKHWLKMARLWEIDPDKEGGCQWLIDGLGYYANRSAPIKAALDALTGKAVV